MADVAENASIADPATAISQGRRHLLVRDYGMAVTVLAQACELLAEKHGDTADELGEPYLLYGRALLGLAREEAGVLGGGVPGSEEAIAEEDEDEDEEGDEEEAANGDSNEAKDGDSADTENEAEKKEAEQKNTGETVEKSDEVEKTKEDEEVKEKKEEEKAEKKEEKEEKKEKKDEKKEEKKEKKEEKEEKEEKKEEKKAETAKVDEKVEEKVEEVPEPVPGPSKSLTNGEASSSRQNGMENGEDEGDDVNKEDDEDEVNNLQIAWEVLELAKLVLLKRGPPGWKFLADAHRLLGEVAMEGGNHPGALIDLQACLDLLEKIEPREPRAIAEIHYQLGLAHSLANDFDASIEQFNQATNLLESRIKELEETKEPPKTDDPFYTVEGEIQELKDLLPEIQEKITDMKDFKQEACKMVIEGIKNRVSGGCSNGAGPSGEGSSTSPKVQKPASDISHLVRKKRKADESENEVASPCKKPSTEKTV